ncbi:hypothetical protein [Acaryochloris marina]|uniref:hypothetical protein n=1 Tax=Acaryochloris marina TaxID=155978 RepID=UPI0020181A21|nr:hypothetical protein [Acaryochloris marina]
MAASTRDDQTICLPVKSETQYRQIVLDHQAFRLFLDKALIAHPELFPPQMLEGFHFHDFVHSIKLDLTLRRIKLTDNGGDIYQIRPDFMMPYMVGKTHDMEKALYLCRFAVPFDAIAYVFGRNAMYWYQAYASLSQASIVGTTIKDPQLLPKHLIVDEKHSWLQGKRVYLPTTAANGCILGVNVTDSASPEALKVGYQVFQQGALQLDPNYAPITANHDGWLATQIAMKALFPTVTLILCFLHAVLKIQKSCRRTSEILRTLTGMLWAAYKQPNKTRFQKSLRKLRKWTKKNVTSPELRQKVFKVCRNAPKFKVAYAFPESYRTSNAVDRLMNHQN